jgi:hypothetical protein
MQKLQRLFPNKVTSRSEHTNIFHVLASDVLWGFLKKGPGRTNHERCNSQRGNTGRHCNMKRRVPPSLRRVNDIKIKLLANVACNRLAQGRIQRWAIWKTEIKRRIPQKATNFSKITVPGSKQIILLVSRNTFHFFCVLEFILKQRVLIISYGVLHFSLKIATF